MYRYAVLRQIGALQSVNNARKLPEGYFEVIIRPYIRALAWNFQPTEFYFSAEREFLPCPLTSGDYAILRSSISR